MYVTATFFAGTARWRTMSAFEVSLTVITFFALRADAGTVRCISIRSFGLNHSGPMKKLTSCIVVTPLLARGLSVYWV